VPLKSIGCNHALFTLRKTIDYYVKHDSTINLCCLDMSRAFDRLSHNILFLKLMDRNVPRGLIQLLKSWYCNLFSCIRWGNAISSYHKIIVGVRQGGILSPSFFAVYVDKVLNKLKKSGLGCFIGGVCLNSLMYADDIILISISVCDLQKMVDLCIKELSSIEMIVNCNKSGGLRIGKRHDAVVKMISVDDKFVSWVGEIKYLGVTILSGKQFILNLQKTKQKYFRALNAIFGKIGVNSSPIVTCSLIHSFCVPILLYASECIVWKQKFMKSIENAYFLAFAKIFHTYDSKVIEYCQYSLGYLPLNLLIDVYKLKFLSKLTTLRNKAMYNILLVNDSEFSSICAKYNFPINTNSNDWRDLMWSYFCFTVNTH